MNNQDLSTRTADSSPEKAACNPAKAESSPEKAELAFVAGDRGAGLVIVGLGAAGQAYTHGGQEIRVQLETEILKPGIVEQTLSIDPEQSIRFRIEWLIPEAARNAAMTLNGGLLISAFAPDWPADGPMLPSPACGHQTPVSTLHPGRFQAIDFIWQSGDVLKLFLIL